MFLLTFPIQKMFRAAIQSNRPKKRANPGFATQQNARTQVLRRKITREAKFCDPKRARIQVLRPKKRARRAAKFFSARFAIDRGFATDTFLKALIW